MVRVKNGKLDINRTMYKDIKKYDREQMNDFLQEIYETGIKYGYEAGLQGSSKDLSDTDIVCFMEKLQLEIADIKGIGAVKLAEIMRIVKKELKELVQDEQKQSD